jgi:hypothetical protein
MTMMLQNLGTYCKETTKELSEQLSLQNISVAFTLETDQQYEYTHNKNFLRASLRVRSVVVVRRDPRSLADGVTHSR